ncbi:MAG: hypothetical protein II823_06650 [Kiritimatiellae bacterium]|nr:hypothetical protein [Kiritimatiellia bacterium]
MNSFWRIFSLELTAAVRSKSLLLLLIASVAWMVAAPFLFVGDGTVEGSRALAVHYSLGGVAALLAVSLLASATGSIAGERSAKRLQLTLVRPVHYIVVALAKMAALVSLGALVLAAATAVEACRSDLSRPCRHVLSPILPTPREEAVMAYEAFMSNPDTPAAAKRAKKQVVLRLLAQRALDRYETIGTNSVAKWNFKVEEASAQADGLAVRLRFTNAYDIRQDVRGELLLRIGGSLWSGSVSNITQAVVEVPLVRIREGTVCCGTAELTFRNIGGSAVMLRPRRDVNLLSPADGFGWNLIRAYVELVAMLSILVAFGVFLGAGLGRPVALFTAIVALIVSEMSPSVIEQYPDELETDRLDAIGLYITRAAAEATHPISSLVPLEKLSEDACIERREVLRTATANMVFAPLILALLAALAMPRKVEV